jgi:hypothetical protein
MPYFPSQPPKDIPAFSSGGSSFSLGEEGNSTILNGIVSVDTTHLLSIQTKRIKVFQNGMTLVGNFTFGKKNSTRAQPVESQSPELPTGAYLISIERNGYKLSVRHFIPKQYE